MQLFLGLQPITHPNNAGDEGDDDDNDVVDYGVLVDADADEEYDADDDVGAGDDDVCWTRIAIKSFLRQTIDPVSLPLTRNNDDDNDDQ